MRHIPDYWNWHSANHSVTMKLVYGPHSLLSTSVPERSHHTPFFKVVELGIHQYLC